MYFIRVPLRKKYEGMVLQSPVPRPRSPLNMDRAPTMSRPRVDGAPSGSRKVEFSTLNPNTPQAPHPT